MATPPVQPNVGTSAPSGPDANDKTKNRYAAQLDDIQSRAAFGVNMHDLIKAKSGGETDYARDVQITMRKEFFTLKQVIVISFWFGTIGLGVGAFVVALMTERVTDPFGPNALMFWGVFMLSLAMSDAVSGMEAHLNLRKCTSEKFKPGDHMVRKGFAKAGDYKVDPSHQGRACLSKWDCSPAVHVADDACTLPKPNAFVHFMRNVVTPVLLLAGVVLTTISFSSTDMRLAKGDLVQAIFYGIGVGNALAVLFS